MEKNTLSQTVRSLFASVLAALLLLTPPARANTAKTQKTDAEAARLMAAGLASLDRGDTSAAIASIDKAVQRQASVSSYFLLGWAHYQHGFKTGATETADRDDAQSTIDAYTKALTLDPGLKELPDRSRLYFSMALCYEAVNSYEHALGAYKKALDAAPSKALIAVHAARLRLKMKDRAKVMSNIDLALKKAAANGQEKALLEQVRRDPVFATLRADGEARKALGIGPAEAGSMDVAMRDAVRDVPARPSAMQDPAVLAKIALGDVEFKFRRYTSAVAAYNEALAVDADRASLGAGQIAEVYEKIGSCYNKLGHPESAVRALQKSLQQDPTNAGAHYQIALAYATAGKTAAALRAVKEAFASASGTAELRRLVLLAKTDMELEGVRGLPGFHSLVAEFVGRVASR